MIYWQNEVELYCRSFSIVFCTFTLIFTLPPFHWGNTVGNCLGWRSAFFRSGLILWLHCKEWPVVNFWLATYVKNLNLTWISWAAKCMIWHKFGCCCCCCCGWVFFFYDFFICCICCDVFEKHFHCISCSSFGKKVYVEKQEKLLYIYPVKATVIN